MRNLTLLAIFTVCCGCSHVPIDTPIGCPAYPDVWDYQDEEMWDLTPETIRETIVHNESRWEAFYDSACGRITRHDEALME